MLNWLAGQPFWLTVLARKIMPADNFILWFSVFTFLCAFATSYAQLFLFRSLQGFGFGGEYTAGAVLIGEDYPQRAPRKG